MTTAWLGVLTRRWLWKQSRRNEMSDSDYWMSVVICRVLWLKMWRKVGVIGTGKLASHGRC